MATKATTPKEPPGDHGPFQVQLRTARKNGYLRYAGEDTAGSPDVVWQAACFEEKRPSVVVTTTTGSIAKIEITSPPWHQFSPIAYEEWETLYELLQCKYRNLVGGFDNYSISLQNVGQASIDRAAHGLIDIWERDTSKTRQKTLKQRLPRPVEGMVRCIDNEGLEEELQLGEVVYIREIPNMLGHAVVLRNNKPPLVGYHLDRFDAPYQYGGG